VPKLLDRGVQERNRSLDAADLVALSGAHTVHGARPLRLPPTADENIDPRHSWRS
jgi:hypothetical protein